MAANNADQGAIWATSAGCALGSLGEQLAEVLVVMSLEGAVLAELRETVISSGTAKVDDKGLRPSPLVRADTNICT